jgi:MFS family permease
MKTETVKSKAATQFKLIIRALRYRNYRLFFAGQSISLIGTWMQQIALSWLVYRLTHSTFLLGLVGFAGQIPTFFLAPFAGAFADRWNRHAILILTQTLAMVQAFVLSFLVLTGMVMMWHVVILNLFLGIINAFDMPTRQSFVVEMIEDKKDLPNAIALNSSMVNGARLLGPSVAGIFIALVGEGICFLVNGISYVAVIASLLLMNFVPKNVKPRTTQVWHEIKEGFHYASGFEPIKAILFMVALVSLMGMPYTVLMPVFAKDILHGGPDAFGFLMGSAGVGALGGVLYLASKKSVLGLGRLIPLAASIFGLGLVAFSFSRVFWFSLILLLVIGLGQMVQFASSNTLLQTIVDDDKRGRIMSFFTTAFMGMTPFGSLFAGAVASKIGAPGTIFVGGMACLAGAALFTKRLPALREKVRPIYIKMGIIPETNSGMQNVSELSMPK